MASEAKEAGQRFNLFVTSGHINNRKRIVVGVRPTLSCGRYRRSIWWTSLGVVTSNFGLGM